VSGDSKTKQGIIDWRGELMGPDDILAKCESEAGRAEVFEYIMRARTAFATMRVMELLGVVPSADDQMAACQIIYETLFRVDLSCIMAFCAEVADSLNKNDEFAGNC
jgi:hypothetical protein